MELVSIFEFSEICGKTHNQIRGLRNYHTKFPKPAQRLRGRNGRYLYRKSDVLKFKETIKQVEKEPETWVLPTFDKHQQEKTLLARQFLSLQAPNWSEIHEYPAF